MQGAGPGFGAIYCIDGGTWSNRPGEHRVTFDRFSRLGECPEVGTEQAHACSWLPPR